MSGDRFFDEIKFFHRKGFQHTLGGNSQARGSMRTSRRLKSELKRIDAALESLNGQLNQLRADSAITHRNVQEAITRAAQDDRAAVVRFDAERSRELRQEFDLEIAALHERVGQYKGASFRPWTDAVWSSFDPESETIRTEFTRVGEFRQQGKYGEFGSFAIFEIGTRPLILKCKGKGVVDGRNLLRSIALRLLVSYPPGQLRFRFVDPAELGSAAAGFVGSLPDSLTSGKVWHDESGIDQQLSWLEEKIASIKTKCLGVRYPRLDAYNQDGGTLHEPYHALLVAEYPVRCRDGATDKLVNILRNGPAAGVHVVVMVNCDLLDERNKFLECASGSANVLTITDQGRAQYDNPGFEDLPIFIDGSPPGPLVERVVEHVVLHSGLLSAIKIPWKQPDPAEWWQQDSRHGFKVAVGTVSAGSPLLFEINESLLSSGLIVGKPGSGKSTFLHVLIHSLSVNFSPDEVEFYLLDCKQVEFKDYATFQLPHARVVAIETEREFGLSVLKRLEFELDDRKKRFTKEGETSLSGYRTRTKAPIQRIILIVDEFQELLSGDDYIAREAARIFDRLVRQGRAFGINVFLASQTLTGQNSLPAATRNQIPIRIVLQCSDSDSRMALSEDNDAARYLERPGEAVFNSANGRPEGNRIFQVSWLNDEGREAVLETLREKARVLGWPRTPLLFDAHSFADIRENRSLKTLTNGPAGLPTKNGPTVWLGDPIEMKAPTSVTFRRQSRSNLLVVGQNEHEEVCVSLVVGALVAISLQHSASSCEFLIVDNTDPTATWNKFCAAFKRCAPHPIRIVTRLELTSCLKDLATAVDTRANAAEGTLAPCIFLVILGLHRDRALRRQELAMRSSSVTTPTLSAAELLVKICREGPSYGVHTMLWADTAGTFQRVFSRGDTDEFAFRVCLQMAESDSRFFLDSDAAHRIGSYRAVLMNDEQNSRIEKFRPYAHIDKCWLEQLWRTTFPENAHATPES